MPKAVAVVDYLDLGREDCYKEIKIGGAVFKRYSQKAINAIRRSEEQSADQIWAKRRLKAKRAKA